MRGLMAVLQVWHAQFVVILLYYLKSCVVVTIKVTCSQQAELPEFVVSTSPIACHILGPAPGYNFLILTFTEPLACNVHVHARQSA